MCVILQGVVQVGPNSVRKETGVSKLAVGSDIVTAKDILGMVTGSSVPFVLPQTMEFQTAYAASMHVYKMIGDGIHTVKVRTYQTCKFSVSII